LYKLAIFDFDGTLVDSAPGIVDVMVDVVKEYKFSDETLELWKHLIGIPLLRQTEILFPDHSHEFHEEVTQRYRDIYDHKAVAICPPFPDLEPMLQSLREAGILMTIATSKRRHLVEAVLDFHRLSDFFQMVVGAQDVSHHKPDPESVQITVDRLGIQLSDTVVIGDSTFDLEMAKNAGVDAIGVTTGIHTAEHLLKAEPKYIVSSLLEVTPLIIQRSVINEN
jgi:phosphoglycolate phosphatase